MNNACIPFCLIVDPEESTDSLISRLQFILHSLYNLSNITTQSSRKSSSLLSSKDQTISIQFNPSKENGVCDVCQGELYQRADDNEETVSKRIQVYLDETKPLVDYYSSQGIIANINGQQSIEKVFEDIVNALGCEK